MRECAYLHSRKPFCGFLKRFGEGVLTSVHAAASLGLSCGKQGVGLDFVRRRGYGRRRLAELPGQANLLMLMRRRNRGPSPVDRRAARGRFGKGCCRTSTRAELKDRLKRGGTNLKQVLTDAENDEILGKMKVSALLEALPKVGKVKAQRDHDRAGDRPDASAARPRRSSRKVLLEKFDFS